MGTGDTIRFRGDDITQIAYCLYCDNCGSFKIERCITPKMVKWILVVAILTAAFWYFGKDEFTHPCISLYLSAFCFGTLLFFVGTTGVLSLGYKCKKCGTVHTSMDNVLNYPANDRSVLDIPYNATKRLYMDDY